MDMFPHVVTVYNTYVETDHSTFEETTVNHITVLRGVLLDASKGSNVTKSGLESADAVNLASKEGMSGQSSSGKQMIKATYGRSLWPVIVFSSRVRLYTRNGR